MNDISPQMRKPGSLRAYYERLLRDDAVADDAPEDTGGGQERHRSHMSKAEVAERIKKLRAELHVLVKTHLGDKTELHDIADQIADKGGEGLDAFREGDEALLAQPDVSANLEVVVRTDGSRPSFMVQNGEANLTTSPMGAWKGRMTENPEALRAAIACVGRINDPGSTQGFQGTGILIGEDLILTNRHVLQAVATQDAASRRWTLKPDITIDFGHEYEARASIDRRDVTEVVFAGAHAIAATGIDHRKLDLALLRLGPSSLGAPANVLKLDTSTVLDEPGQTVLIIGYPGRPGQNSIPDSLVEQLFRSTFGHKRVAPGAVMSTTDQVANSPRGWTVGHDATTLGGNSGSAVVIISRLGAAAGLHYGGRWSDPRENWCHLIGKALDATDGSSDKTLREHFAENGVQYY